MLILMLLNLNTGYADTDADLCIRIMSLWCTNTFDPVTLNLEFDLFLKTLPLFITFEKWVLEFWYFPWVFLVSRPFFEYNNFYLVTLTLYFVILFENFKFVENIWTVHARILLFHLSILFDKPFVLICDLYLIFLKGLTFLITFEKLMRCFLFHMSIPWFKTLLWVLTIFTMFYIYLDLEVWHIIKKIYLANNIFNSEC